MYFRPDGLLWWMLCIGTEDGLNPINLTSGENQAVVGSPQVA